MEKFDENSCCPKCGNKDVWSAGYEHDDNRWLHHITQVVREKREHIRRTCGRCHYMWNEAPLDAAIGEGGKGNENNA